MGCRCIARPSRFSHRPTDGGPSPGDSSYLHIRRLGSIRQEGAGYAIHELAMNAEAIYRSPKAETEEQRLLLSYAFSNLTLKAQEIRPEYTLAFQFLQE